MKESWFHYRLRFVHPVRFGRSAGIIREKTGYLIRNPTHDSWGEIPLPPGDQLEEALIPLWSTENGKAPQAVRDAFQMLKNPPADMPQLRMAKLMFPDDPLPSGNHVVKVKITGAAHDTERLIKMAEEYPALRFRPDGNRSFRLSELKEFLRRVESADLPPRIDFLEEPLADPEEYRQLGKVSIPLAADETLEKGGDDSWAQVLVLKPFLTGFSTAEKIITRARVEKRRLIFSSSFETSAGLRYLAAWAYRVSPEEWHGLDTSRWIENPPLLPVFPEIGPLSLSVKADVRKI